MYSSVWYSCMNEVIEATQSDAEGYKDAGALTWNSCELLVIPSRHRSALGSHCSGMSCTHSCCIFKTAFPVQRHLGMSAKQ